MNATEILVTRNLEKYFGRVRAVQGVNLSVHQGEIYGFLGPNGAGKTTTISMLLGLVYPSAGEVRLFGERVTPSSTAPLQRVGSLAGAPALELSLTARENLLLAARLVPNMPRERVDEVLEWIGLRGSAAVDRPTRAFSTGMKQRLGLGLALLSKPDLLILDEPTNGMDPAGMREVRLLLAGLAEQGMTIFLSSHLLHEVEQVCNRVAVLNQGKVVAEGPVSQLLTGRQDGRPQVKVMVDQPGQAAALLERMPGVREVCPNGTHVLVSGPTSQEIIRWMVRHDQTPTEVVNVRPDLESLFLALTQETEA